MEPVKIFKKKIKLDFEQNLSKPYHDHKRFSSKVVRVIEPKGSSINYWRNLQNFALKYTNYMQSINL